MITAKLGATAVAFLTFTISTASGAWAAPVQTAPIPSVTFDGPVDAAVYSGNVIYLGGDFTHATVDGTRFGRTRLAAVDARNGQLLDWTPEADAAVTSIAADASGVYIGGPFTEVNGVARDSLAKLDGLTGDLLKAFDHTVYGQPEAFALGHGRLYVGGSLISIDGIPRQRLAAFDAATGKLDPTWKPAANESVFAVAVSAGRVYVGGRFDDVNGAPATRKMAAVTPDTGQVDPTFVSSARALVTEIRLDGDTVYAAVAGNGGKAVAMDLTGAKKWSVTLDGDVVAIAVLSGVVYLGGHFDRVCKTDKVGLHGTCLDGSDTRIKVAAVGLDGQLLPWTANGNGTVGVHTLIADSRLGELVVGGEFTLIGGLAQPRFALFLL